MMWTKGQPWRVADSLQTLNEQIRGYAPRAVPPATDVNAWGSIADDAHSSSSDHYPHFYSTLGTTAVVCARDFPHAPALGLDGGVVTEALRISRDSRIGYLIFNRRITGPNHGWEWQSYTGSDPHDTHFHVSSVHAAAADDTRAWTLPGAAPTIGEDIMFVRNPANGGIFLAAGGAIVGVEDGEWKNCSPGSERGLAFTNMPASLIAKAAAATAGTTPQALAAALVPVLAPALAAALPDNVDAAAVIAAFDDPHVQQVLVQAANTAEDS